VDGALWHFVGESSKGMRSDSLINSASSEYRILSRHSFVRRRIRFTLPLFMLGVVLTCLVAIPPKVRLYEVIGLAILIYVVVSTLVSVCELTVVETGLIVNRLLLPAKFTPWDAIERVSVLEHQDTSSGVQIEIATIGFYSGLSPLNRLPGLVYGHGFRQTIVVLKDAVEDYDALIDALKRHCFVEKTQARR
jgi:uncharacterized membrane protein YfcA